MLGLAKEKVAESTVITIPSPINGRACMWSSFRGWMIEGVAVSAAVPADWEAEDQAEAAGEVETDQGPV
jgi:hypothetical protein